MLSFESFFEDSPAPSHLEEAAFKLSLHTNADFSHEKKTKEERKPLKNLHSLTLSNSFSRDLLKNLPKKRDSSKKDSCKNLSHGHRMRLKERFLREPLALEDYEILEMILFWIYPRQDVKPKAKALLAEHKTLARVLQNLQEKGSSSLKFNATLILEIARRLLAEDLYEGELLNNPQKVLEYCRLTMGNRPNEQFRIFYLDRKYRLITEDIEKEGTVDQVPLYPREVLRRALDVNATSIILVHNHPSGDTTPSKADIDLTNFLRSSLLPFNITIVDHFIVGRNQYFSFRENHLLT